VAARRRGVITIALGSTTMTAQALDSLGEQAA
jgi:hypothetical protein